MGGGFLLVGGMSKFQLVGERIPTIPPVGKTLHAAVLVLQLRVSVLKSQKSNNTLKEKGYPRPIWMMEF